MGGGRFRGRRSRPGDDSLQGWGVFSLDPAFALSSIPLASLALCEVRMQSDARFPWLILIPRVAAARELEDLEPDEATALVRELGLAGRAVRAMAEAAGRPVHKLNIGLLGNLTPQLHAHVIGRRPDDPAWPGPVWGWGQPLPYQAPSLEAARDAALRALRAGA